MKIEGRGVEVPLEFIQESEGEGASVTKEGRKRDEGKERVGSDEN